MFLLRNRGSDRNQLLSDSNTNVNSTFNRRVSLFYRYPLEASHHMVCPCTLYGVCVVSPVTSELVGQQICQQVLFIGYPLPPQLVVPISIFQPLLV